MTPEQEALLAAALHDMFFGSGDPEGELHLTATKQHIADLAYDHGPLEPILMCERAIKEGNPPPIGEPAQTLWRSINDDTFNTFGAAESVEFQRGYVVGILMAQCPGVVYAAFTQLVTMMERGYLVSTGRRID